MTMGLAVFLFQKSNLITEIVKEFIESNIDDMEDVADNRYNVEPDFTCFYVR